jgi:hypothetical protein
MTDKDQYLRERTFKGGPFNVHQRMLNTPIDERKAFAWLVNHLHEKGVLSVDDVGHDAVRRETSRRVTQDVDLWWTYVVTFSGIR